MEEHNTDQSTEGLKTNLKNRKEMICDFALSYIEHLESELEKLTVMRCSTELKDKYKTDFDLWKVTNGYVKDLKHKCYFKGEKAYFDFNLIIEYNQELMSL